MYRGFVLADYIGRVVLRLYVACPFCHTLDSTVAKRCVLLKQEAKLSLV